MECLEFCEDKYFPFVESETKVILQSMCIMQMGSHLFCYSQLPSLFPKKLFFLSLVISVSVCMVSWSSCSEFLFLCFLGLLKKIIFRGQQK